MGQTRQTPTPTRQPVKDPPSTDWSPKLPTTRFSPQTSDEVGEVWDLPHVQQGGVHMQASAEQLGNAAMQERMRKRYA